jgi:3-oxoacyl-[acyl-carrier-protein] synthase-3
VHAVGIIGTGSYLPVRVLTNRELEQRIETTDAWIREKTGIRERRIAAEDEATSDLAVQASREALRNAGVRPSEIDLVLLATSSPDMIQPPVACMVQGRIGASNAAAFDVGAVCSGFVYALSIAGDLMKGNPRYRRVLVVAAETYSRILDWTDRNTCVFFGDGASAVVLGRVSGDKGILSSRLYADGLRWDVIRYPAGGTRHPATHETLAKGLRAFQMDGKAVWRFVEEAFPRAVRDVLASCGLGIEDVDFLISHQANAVLIAHCMKILGLPMSKTHLTVDRYGNTSGASVGITLDEAVRLGKVRDGDRIVLVGFGGGLTSGAVLLKWGP